MSYSVVSEVFAGFTLGMYNTFPRSFFATSLNLHELITWMPTERDQRSGVRWGRHRIRLQ
jgi:hypothetical protein